MTRADQYKQFLRGGELDTLSKEEPALREFVDALFSDKLVLIRSEEEILRVQKLMVTTGATSNLYNNFNHFFKVSKNEQELMLAALNSKGFDTSRFAELYGAIMCHMYQTTSERFKIHLCAFIDFKKIGVKRPHKRPLGDLLKALKRKYPNNSFIKSLDTFRRNAVTHYTYFFDKGKLFLCNGIFDRNPKEIEIHNFMKEVKNQSIFSEMFLISVLDKIVPGKDLKINAPLL